jgi:hypothetical protein
MVMTQRSWQVWEISMGAPLFLSGKSVATALEKVIQERYRRDPGQRAIAKRFA